MIEANFDIAYEKVKELVAKFQQGENHYLSQAYSEAAVRQDFLDDFFTALGWDVGHKYQYDPYEQEVKIEKGVKFFGTQKRADYSFAIAPNCSDPKFYVEAKKPANALKNAQDYFQSIRYGWHHTHTFSILTNFVEFHILDCRYIPDINYSLDKCYKRFHYTDYLNKEKFAEIYFLFSHDAVANNSIEKVAETLPKRKGKATSQTLFPLDIHQDLDEAFLILIDSIREILAKAFKKKNDKLTSEELTEATQRTVDRLVFIRFLEDKLIEQEHYVSEFGEKGTAWNDFISVCKKLDAKYNGIVFKKHFIDEQNFAGPVENEFRSICKDICHLNSRFLYHEIPIHILGSIYERFLGKVVHATAKRVTVDEKPEVKKAGGVYYTPKYIVDYIVRNTVGKLIEGKTPEQIAELHFADIACGSGSFLIGVLDCLLVYHNKFYRKHPDKAKKDGCHFLNGMWVLSIRQKQKIMLNNIYGVDIDQQAVEVTQLSLALKMLEDETTATANDMQVLFHEKILPDMHKHNIICGNSLIGKDILNFNGFFSGEEERKLTPMNFKDVFKEVMRNGGFDAIVGNPPYLSTKGISENEKKYFLEFYETAKGQFDLYGLFVEKAIKNTKQNGMIGYITSNTFLSNKDFAEFRKFILNKTTISEIINLGETVFKDANLDVSIIIIEKNIQKNSKIKITVDRSSFDNKISHFVKQSNFNDSKNNFEIHIKILETDLVLLEKVFNSKSILGKYLELPRGMELGSNAEVITKQSKPNYEKLLVGKNINKYEIIFDEMYINLGKDLSVYKDENIYNTDKILIQRIRNLSLKTRIVATFDNENYLCTNTLRIGLKKEKEYDLRFFLGVINSKLINYIFLKMFLNKDIYAYQLERIPFPFESYNKIPNTILKNIIRYVEQMLEAKKEIKTAKTDKDKNYYERKCDGLDIAIDAEVYKLYDISNDEIAIIENNNK